MKGLSLHNEGLYLTIIISILSLLSLIFFDNKVFLLLLAVLTFIMLTYRIPVRVTPPTLIYNQIVSPVDGLVKEIDIITRPMELDSFVKQEKLLRIKIAINYMVNNMIYSPVEGFYYHKFCKSSSIMNHVKYLHNKLKNYFKNEKLQDHQQFNQIDGNDYMILGIQTLDKQKIILTQISSYMPYSCQNHIGKDEAIIFGERIGMMRFGGMVEIYLPVDSYVFVYPGKTLIGSETIIGVMAVNKVRHILESYRNIVSVKQPDQAETDAVPHADSMNDNQEQHSKHIRYCNSTLFKKKYPLMENHAGNKSEMTDRLMQIMQKHQRKNAEYSQLLSNSKNYLKQVNTVSDLQVHETNDHIKPKSKSTKAKTTKTAKTKQLKTKKAKAKKLQAS